MFKLVLHFQLLQKFSISKLKNQRVEYFENTFNRFFKFIFKKID